MTKMSKKTREDLAHLAATARTFNDQWEEDEGLEWQDAEDLVAMIEEIMNDSLTRPVRSVFQDIMRHVKSNEDWDCDEVGQWPHRIMKAVKDQGIDF